jgi:bacterial/archaeal transporter family-2 protein
VRPMIVIYVLLAAAIGAGVVVQASINGDLRLVVGDPYRTALISTTVSTIFLFALSGVLVGKPVPDASTFTNASWWMWIGGVLGAIYVAAATVLVTKLGSAVMFTLVIFGQLLMAVVMDHFGLIGLDKHPVTAPRVLGIVLVLAGVVLVRRS